MIYINKSDEPKNLIEYRNTINASFDDMDREVKDELREHLLKEQKYLCAYCMSRISNDRNTKIEHYRPRNTENELQYGNLFAVCKGNEGQIKELQTCDTHKGNISLSINPMKVHHIQSIAYKSDGTIYSSNDTFNYDINYTLNLNCDRGYLKTNRKAALTGFLKKLRKIKPGIEAKSFLMKMKEFYEGKEKQEPYIGIILYDIEKRLKRYI